MAKSSPNPSTPPTPEAAPLEMSGPADGERVLALEAFLQEVPHLDVKAAEILRVLKGREKHTVTGWQSALAQILSRPVT